MNKRRVPYTYSVLRYVHDIVTGEFINVGVVVVTAQPFRVAAKFRTTFSRLKGAFPSLDSEVFRDRMKGLNRVFQELSEVDLRHISEHPRTLAGALAAVLPHDDSALQWAPAGGGLTTDIRDALEKRYDRFVSAHDTAYSARKKDDDVWRKFRNELEVRNVLGRLKEKDIRVADDAVHFEHAWKNGKWNCLEPLSFDLASAESIKQKALQWLGQLESVKDSPEPFEVFFLCGAPSSDDLHSAYERALSLLRKAHSAQIVEESEAVVFSERLAADMARHDAQLKLPH